MTTYEQQMKNIRDTQQKALAGLFADIATDDAHLKTIYAKWRAQGLTQQFGFSMKGASKQAPEQASDNCSSGTCPRPRGRAPGGATWDATNGTWDFGALVTATAEVSKSKSKGKGKSKDKSKDKDARVVGCRHRFVRGANKGKLCNEKKRSGKDYCSQHWRAHEEESDSSDSSDPYDSDPYDSDSYDSDPYDSEESESESESE